MRNGCWRSRSSLRLKQDENGYVFVDGRGNFAGAFTKEALANLRHRFGLIVQMLCLPFAVILFFVLAKFWPIVL
jgi:hypothetical protein